MENGHFNTPVTKLVIEEYLKDIRDAGVDTLIMGCTHYPLLKTAIREYMGDSVALISPGEQVAQYLKKKLTEETRHDNNRDKNPYSYYVSDSVETFEALGSIFLEREINGQVGKVDIEEY